MANLPAECPNCGASRVGSPERFEAGHTLCTQCEDQLHDREMTMEQEHHPYASRYHRASRLLSAAEEWGWGHSHTCPDCTETFYCNQSGCRAGPRTCQTCEDLQAAETVRPPEGYSDKAPADLALLDL